MSKNWTDGLDGLLSRPHIALSFVHALQIAEANNNCAHNYRRAPHFGLYAHASKQWTSSFFEKCATIAFGSEIKRVLLPWIFKVAPRTTAEAVISAYF